MAFYIEIKKVSDDTNAARYIFFSDDVGLGILEIGKKTGEVSIIKAAPYDFKGNVAQRASVKIIRHWMEGKLPEKTCWAS